MSIQRPPVLLWTVWTVLTTVAVVAIPIQVRFGTLSPIEESALNSGLGVALAYVLSTLALGIRAWQSSSIRFFDILAVFAICIASVALIGLFGSIPYSRSTLLLALLLAGGFTLVPLLLSRRVQTLLSVSLLVVLLALPFMRTPVPMRGLPGAGERQQVHRTIFHNLLATSYEGIVGPQEATGGGLARLGNRVLLAKGDGSLFVVWLESESDELRVRQLPYRVPLNRDEFIQDADAWNAKQPPSSYPVEAGYFRTAAILVQELGDRFTLFASHHNWDPEEGCYNVRVSSLSGNVAAFVQGRERESWATVYESKPCLEFKSKSHPFGGYQIGGRLFLLNERELLVALGDHEFDGEESVESVSQDANVPYGKTILVNLRDRTSSIFTTGHRNPQGLYVDAQRNIWMTEHGPKGGDELNLITAGQNYGWPLVTYGAAYTYPSWPFNALQNRHEGFQQPVYAWVPSIGISGIIQLKGDRLKTWTNDLLAGSLSGESLYRIRVHDGRVLFVERVRIRRRIRDLIEMADGRLLLWSEGGFEPPTDAVLTVIDSVDTPEDAAKITSPVERGALLFSRCSGCHPMEESRGHGLGPNLTGAYRRGIASAQGFSYSAALKDKRGVWTEANLEAFLSAPQRFAPGTTMPSVPITNETELDGLVEYIKSRRRD